MVTRFDLGDRSRGGMESARSLLDLASSSYVLLSSSAVDLSSAGVFLDPETDLFVKDRTDTASTASMASSNVSWSGDWLIVSKVRYQADRTTKKVATSHGMNVPLVAPG